MKIVETDNFGGDYPNESFLKLPPLTDAHAAAVAAAINEGFTSVSQEYPRYWRAVPDDYRLQPGFVP